MSWLGEWTKYADDLAEDIRQVWAMRQEVRVPYVLPAVHAMLRCCDGQPPLDTREHIDQRMSEVQVALRAAALATVADDDDRISDTVDRLAEPGSARRKVLCWLIERQIKSSVEELDERGWKCSRLLARRQQRKIEAREVEALLEEMGLEEDDAAGKRIGAAGFCERHGIDPITLIILISAAINIVRFLILVYQWWKNRPHLPQPTLQLGEP